VGQGKTSKLKVVQKIQQCRGFLKHVLNFLTRNNFLLVACGESAFKNKLFFMFCLSSHLRSRDYQFFLHPVIIIKVL